MSVRKTRLVALTLTAAAGFTLALLLGGRPLATPTFLEAPGQEQLANPLVPGTLTVARGRSITGALPAGAPDVVRRRPVEAGTTVERADLVREP
jgi:hypothetical protein